MRTFDIKAYFQELDDTEDPVVKILLKRAFKQYVNSLSEQKKIELNQQETAYFEERFRHYDGIIVQAKQQMKAMGLEV